MSKRIVKGMLLAGLAIIMLGGCGDSKEETSTSTEKVKSETKTSEKEKIVPSEEVVLYVTRHGKTMFNTIGRVQGWADTPLTDEGIKVADDLGKGFAKENIQFDKVYSSDLGRARQTAQVISEQSGKKGVDVIEDSRLREACYGMYEGSSGSTMMTAIYKDLDTTAEEFNAMGMAMWTTFANTVNKIDERDWAEDADTIKKRMTESIQSIAKEATAEGKHDVLVVGHGMSICLMLSELTDKEFKGHLPNASVSKIVYKDGKFDVQTIGDTSYSDAVKEEE